MFLVPWWSSAHYFLYFSFVLSVHQLLRNICGSVAVEHYSKSARLFWGSYVLFYSFIIQEALCCLTSSHLINISECFPTSCSEKVEVINMNAKIYSSFQCVGSISCLYFVIQFISFSQRKKTITIITSLSKEAVTVLKQHFLQLLRAKSLPASIHFFGVFIKFWCFDEWILFQNTG